MNSENILQSCIICQKKSPYNMQCRCLEWTCKKHRDQSKHNCKFDFSVGDISSEILSLLS